MPPKPFTCRSNNPGNVSRMRCQTCQTPYRGGMAANVFSMFSRTASVERTPASRDLSRIAAVDLRASPQVPDFVAQYTEPGEVKKNAVCTGAVFTVKSGNGGNSAFAASMYTRV